MKRPDHCPNCGSGKVTAHTGSYCEECGEPLFPQPILVGYAKDPELKLIAKQRTEHEAWLAVVRELSFYNINDFNKDGKHENLHDAIVLWGEELAQLRMNDPNPEHAANALSERRAKYLGTE